MRVVDYERLEVYRLEGWIWQIHENQCYLGRVILRLERPDTGSLVHCTKTEWVALQENLKRYEKLASNLFDPDRFNYSQLGNIYHQLHVHAVPRYSSSREWQGKTFVDRKWGNNWSPTPRSPLTLAETYAFAQWFQSRISKRK
jgi:diadenosine tetraphosphate (Ap4A) HIT family hydrolase